MKYISSSNLSEVDKRKIRAGYFAKEKKYLDEGKLSSLNSAQLNHYLTYKKSFTNYANEAVQGLAGVALFIGLITSPVWISSGWGMLFGEKQASNSLSAVSNVNGGSTPGMRADDIDGTSSLSSTSYEDGECNPNYSPCIPDDSHDLDCADVGTRVEVVGVDEYRLDRDGDGYGCESY